jgi:uncharacterized membrane protein
MESDNTQRELDAFCGGSAEIRMLTGSMQTLYIDLWKQNCPERLFVGCTGPSYICAPMKWAPINLQILRTEGCDEVVLRDTQAGVTIKCWSVDVTTKPIQLWRIEEDPKEGASSPTN